MNEPEFEIVGPDGVQVLRGIALAAHAILHLVVQAKEKIQAERSRAEQAGQHVRPLRGAELSWLLPMGTEAAMDFAESWPEPHRTHTLDAVSSLIRMGETTSITPEWTAGEVPIVKAKQASAAADARLTAGMSDNERLLDDLQGLLRELRSRGALMRDVSKKTGVPAVNFLGWIRRMRGRVAAIESVPGSAKVVADLVEELDRLERDLDGGVGGS